MRARIVAGNWKMHGSRGAAAELIAQLKSRLQAQQESQVGVAAPADEVEVLVFPPALQVAAVVAASAGSAIAVGVQNVHPATEGAFTGEISAEMAADAGASWALVGHSERRQHFHEDDIAVAERCAAVLRAGLRPILCVGETLAARRAGRDEEVVLAQLDAVLAQVGDGLARGAVAYEPVWAIGTGETATPEQAQAMHAAIRARLEQHDLAHTPILYGGSVKPDNATALFGQVDVDGGLVGGASLDAASFAGIISAAVQTR